MLPPVVVTKCTRMALLNRLRLIQFRAGYNVVVHAAIERGLFARHGLEVEAAYTPGSLYLADALRGGEFDVGHTGADDVIADVGTHSGSDLFLFMGLHSGLLSLVSAPKFQTVEALRGQRLAVDAKTSGFVFILEKGLRSRGLAVGDYTLMEVGGWERRHAALLAGNCAATLLTPPYSDHAISAGCHLLLEGHELVPVYQATCGVAGRKWAAANADLLVRYIRAYVEATRWCFEPRNRVACLELLSRHNRLLEAAAAQTLDALLDPKHGLYPRAELNLRGITAAIRLRAEMGYLSNPLPRAEAYIDLSYYRRAVGSN